MDHVSSSDFWAALSGVGTLLAVVVALGLAVWTERANTRRELGKAVAVLSAAEEVASQAMIMAEVAGFDQVGDRLTQARAVEALRYGRIGELRAALAELRLVDFPDRSSMAEWSRLRTMIRSLDNELTLTATGQQGPPEYDAQQWQRDLARSGMNLRLERDMYRNRLGHKGPG